MEFHARVERILSFDDVMACWVPAEVLPADEE